MGKNIFTEYDYTEAIHSRGISHEAPTRVTAKAEQKVRETGKLDPAVDPGVDPIRRSLLRFDPTGDKRWEVTVGCPINIETTLDTTGSMGNNVDIAMKALPQTYQLAAEMLPGYDPQLALGIFGDVCDKFVLCRPQFEMTAEKIVDYLTRMHPEGNGGDGPEDPQYAAFAAAYLTDAYTNRIGIKGYHFTVTDASCHLRISADTLERIFGKGIWKALKENNHSEITERDLPDVQDVYIALSEGYHAFLININGDLPFWEKFYGERVITMHDAKGLAAVQAALIGVTEGTLKLLDVEKYLKAHGVYEPSFVAESIGRQRFAEQRRLEQLSVHRIPKAGDIFAKKTDLQPVIRASEDVEAEKPAADDAAEDKTNEKPTEGWL